MHLYYPAASGQRLRSQPLTATELALGLPAHHWIDPVTAEIRACRLSVIVMSLLCHAWVFFPTKARCQFTQAVSHNSFLPAAFVIVLPSNLDRGAATSAKVHCATFVDHPLISGPATPALARPGAKCHLEAPPYTLLVVKTAACWGLLELQQWSLLRGGNGNSMLHSYSSSKHLQCRTIRPSCICFYPFLASSGPFLQPQTHVAPLPAHLCRLQPFWQSTQQDGRHRCPNTD